MTLTMEPKDWIDISLEDEAVGASGSNAGPEITRGDRIRHFKGFEVELRRKPEEGFGFVIASQEVKNGKGGSYYHQLQLKKVQSEMIFPTGRTFYNLLLVSIWFPAH